MKRTREIVTPAIPEKVIPTQPEHRRTVTENICDVCEKMKAIATCFICGRYVCGKCNHPHDVDNIGGDYSCEDVCGVCFALRAKYHAKEGRLEEEHEKQDAALRDEWKAESLAREKT